MKIKILFIILVALALICFKDWQMIAQEKNKNEDSSDGEYAVFAGGCFWCIEASFEKIEGVTSAISGYAGGKKEDANYEKVCTGATDHLEVVKVNFDPKKISFTELLAKYWQMFDPTDDGGSFYDRGKQYTSAIFYVTDEQKLISENSKKVFNETKIFEKPMVTSVSKLQEFFEAEEYHQNYYKKDPEKYYSYRKGSGRDKFINKTWAGKTTPFIKPTERELRLRLTELEFKVTQEEGTELPFKNKYYDHKEKGIYIDVISKEALFSSLHKYDSKTGWPSFFDVIKSDFLLEKTDTKLGYKRVEVRSKIANSHLGHVFEDGPEPTGLRYCINSAALEFVPLEKMEEMGYKEFIPLFTPSNKK